MRSRSTCSCRYSRAVHADFRDSPDACAERWCHGGGDEGPRYSWSWLGRWLLDGEGCPVPPGNTARNAAGRSVNDGGDDMATTMNGTIKRLVGDKGFGFIAAGDGNEYFFHQSACTQTAFDELR